MNFKVFFGGIMVFFIAVLIGAYIIAKKSNPIMLDEHGKPLETTTSTR